MNPNHGPDTMQEHASQVWNKFVKESKFSNVLVLAHSAGGGCVSRIIKDHPDSFFGKVKQLAYTDSWIAKRTELNDA